ncbi:hypothetical protein CLV93_10370 [Prolixibacter denitrificans]|uniref:Uncharacterized protein n=1 Tax=Prolixibacter denitrificans TaxID=1541063 RepID=A0A2P8CFA0_9BACT|nr:hypothetical protein CLV93_10370 [Prolixibacter denitrificans]
MKTKNLNSYHSLFITDEEFPTCIGEEQRIRFLTTQHKKTFNATQNEGITIMLVHTNSTNDKK